MQNELTAKVCQDNQAMIDREESGDDKKSRKRITKPTREEVIYIMNHSVKKQKRRLISVFKFLIILCISYVILAPIVVIISNSFFTANDVYSPIVSLIPEEGTLQNYELSFKRLDYPKTMLYTMIYVITLTMIQIFICSMTGYGFARFKFPLKKLMFGCVILTFVIPTHTIMLPLYMTFRNIDFFGLIQGTTGGAVNLLGTKVPMYVMTILGVGLRSGLYIYIFNQFFRGLPKEIEEAAFVDGAGMIYTYFRIMLVNAVPAIITCTVFSLVWQYNDSFYTGLFSMDSKYILSMKLNSLRTTIEYIEKIQDSAISQTYVYAGVLMALIPIVLIYLILQKYFIEGVERSGIVG